MKNTIKNENHYNLQLQLNGKLRKVKEQLKAAGKLVASKMTGNLNAEFVECIE